MWGEASRSTAIISRKASIWGEAGETVTKPSSAVGGEQRVVRRLLEGPPIVLATGGGAMLNPDTRTHLKRHAVTVWLKADLSIVARRVAKRDTRPLLRGKDPAEILKGLAEARYPIYAEADLVVETGGGAHAEAVEAIIKALTDHQAETGA